MHSEPLRGRVALVTGVSRRGGIGYAIARRLAEYGADLFIQGWDAYDAQFPWNATAEGTAEIIRDLSAIARRADFEDPAVPEHLAVRASIRPRVDGMRADFEDPAAPEQLVARAFHVFAHVDILIANHAYSTDGALETVTAEDIDRHHAVNVRATLLLVKAWSLRHDGRPGGRVVMMTSGQHQGPMPGELAYVASKAALHGLTASLAQHLAPRGITVNTVNPGATDTGYPTDAIRAAILEREPMGRWGMPDDAARLIAWLATDEARWITGQVINSTGGGP